MVLDVETAGGAWRDFPLGFNLLFAGLRHGGDYSVYANEPASRGGASASTT